MLKQKMLNYITLIFAIMTIFIALVSNENNTSRLPAIIMLVITLIIGHISRKYNDEITNISKKEKEILNEVKKAIKNDELKKNNKYNKINEKKKSRR